MEFTNYEVISKAVKLLSEGLVPFVARECRVALGDNWLSDVQRTDQSYRVNPEDLLFLLNVMLDKWQPIFRKELSFRDRNYIFELRDVRNSWAHQKRFSTDDTLRALDTAKRLLKSVAAADQAIQVDNLYQDLLRQTLSRPSEQEVGPTGPGHSSPAAASPNRPTYDSNPTSPEVSSKEYSKRPTGYTLFGDYKPWQSGIGMWADVVKEVHSRNRHNFLERAKKLELERSSRFHGKLISDNLRDISRPRNSGVNGIYIERSLTISQLIELAYKLLRMFGHTDSDLVIYWD